MNHNLCPLCAIMECIRQSLVLHTGAGQSWDPFRPVQKSQPAESAGIAAAASGISKAYARERSNKLVLQIRQSGAPVEVPDADKARRLQKEGQLVPAPQSFLYQSITVKPAAPGTSLSSSTTGQAATSVLTGRSSAGGVFIQRLHRQALQGRGLVLQQKSQTGTAQRSPKIHAKTWTRRTTPATVAHPGTPRPVQAVGPTREHKPTSGIHPSCEGLQQCLQSPKFALRRVNQLVRVSSLASQRPAAQRSWLGEWSGTMLSIDTRVAAPKHFAADSIIKLSCCHR